MHILFLTQVLPYPLDAGPKMRAYYTLRHLGRRHDITLLSFVRPSDTPEAVEHLRTEIPCQAIVTVPMVRSRWRDLWHLARSLARRTPFLIARDWVPAMVRQLEELVQGMSFRGTRNPPTFDAIHADQLWMAPYALYAQQLYPDEQKPLTVLDQHNAVFQIPRRLAQHESNPLKRLFWQLEAFKMARYEWPICEQFDQVVWVSEEDRAAVAGQKAKQRGTSQGSERAQPLGPVIPICVDPTRRTLIPRQPDARRVTFLGGLHWPPNSQGVHWFVRQVWPHINQAVPDAQLTLIGKDPPNALKAACQAYNNIELTGYVPDIHSYLAETAAFIVPILAGGGMRVKILDAWCWGMPIVSTPLGAEGFHLNDGQNILLADTPQAFAQQVARLLKEPSLGTQLAAGGREAIKRYYDWRTVYEKWDEVVGKE